jgi:kynureninase
MDDADPLAGLRDRFTLPDGLIYLDGNSLGALPAAVAPRLAGVVGHEWGQRLIRSWNEAAWFTAPGRVAAAVARLIGADADEVAVADSTSVNLFKILIAGARMRPGRGTLIMHAGDFPTDVYIGSSAAELAGLRLRFVDSPAQAPAAIDDDTALVAMSHVDFRTGELADVTAITEAAHSAGALVCWDLSHSAGALDLDLHAVAADLAVGCGYKYLNGGPGAPGYAMVARRHHDALITPLPGWIGHADPFAMSPRYAPAAGVARLAAGTPPMLSLLAMESSLSALDGVSPQALRTKAAALTSYFVELVDALPAARRGELTVASPRDPARRGAQVSLRHEQAYGLVRALIEREVIGDFRTPDLARFGFAPAYLRFADVWDAVTIIADVLDGGAHRDPRFAVRAGVT